MIRLALTIRQRKVIMNTQSNRYPAILIALAIVFAMACNAIPPLFTPLQATPTAEILHFENELVAFDYKYVKGMEVFEGGKATFQCNPPFELGGELVVGLGIYKYSGLDTSYYRSIRIFRQPMPFDSNLETIMREAYQKAEVPRGEGLVNATGPVTVDGLSAFQWTYRVYVGEPAFEMRDVWIPKDGELFIIAIWTQWGNPDSFAAFQAEADALLDSLHIK
jgi:hypothetical protein